MSESAGVTYTKVDKSYFDKRGLRRYAGVWSLWALGVGAVISGHFSGWNFGLAQGWGSLLIATVIISVMYLGLTFSLAEMSPALPHTGGAYSFARSGDEANEFLDDAKDFKKTGQALLYGGLAVAGIDAALYYLKLRKIRRKQKLYDDFCVPKTSFLTLRPLANPLVSGRATLGARLEWRF